MMQPLSSNASSQLQTHSDALRRTKTRTYSMRYRRVQTRTDTYRLTQTRTDAHIHQRTRGCLPPAPLGYPGRNNGAPLSANVVYQDADRVPYRDAPGQQLCYVPLLEFEAAPSDAERVGDHFAACARGMQRLGVTLVLDLSFCGCWPDRAVSRCWASAFGDGVLAAQHRGWPDPRWRRFS